MIKKKIIRSGLEKAIEILKKGGVAVLPTDTCYGLTTGISSNEGIRRIAEMKKRNSDKPFIILVNSKKLLGQVVSEIPFEFESLSEEFWPGPVTFVMKASENLNPLIVAETGTVAVRNPDCRVLSEIIDAIAEPVISTSANISGDDPPYEIENISVLIRNRCDCLLDGGNLKIVPPSTILNISIRPFCVLRSGPISEERFQKYL